MKEPFAQTHDEDTKQTTHRLNKFALDLYQKLKEQDGNLFLSPFSISTCLAMAYGGARGETAKQMAQALHFPGDQQRLHRTLGNLLQNLSAESPKRSYHLVVANALWGQKGYPVLQEFLDLLTTDVVATAASWQHLKVELFRLSVDDEKPVPRERTLFGQFLNRIAKRLTQNIPFIVTEVALYEFDRVHGNGVPLGTTNRVSSALPPPFGRAPVRAQCG